jgi:hypothetical protein
LGIDTFFAISTTAAEHTPEIADKLFVWPVFVDAEIYHDYGGWKSIPVLFSGNTNQLYPWRKKILKIVSEHYPSLICPHPGYGPSSNAVRVMVGEDYARTINASWFVPACGTVAKEVVRKHFEIPASKSCLVTEKSPSLLAAGFVDMKNCVFVDEHDVLDKLGYLFQHPAELRAITDAGYELVHSRHTLKHRDQILQWFNLHQKLKANEKIVQTGPFGPLTIVPESSAVHSSHMSGDGLHLVLLRQGDEKLWGGKYEEAERLYLKCLSYMPWMPEPKLRLALCNLYKGDAKTALSWIDEPIHFILGAYKAIDPDPVEWACFMLSLLCLGKINEAVLRGDEFPWLRHPELDRARWVARVLKTKGGTVACLVSDDKSGRRYSLHRFPARSLKEWIEQLCIMLKACGQHDMAKTLTNLTYSSSEILQEGHEEGVTRVPGKNFVGPEGSQEKKGPSKSTLSFFRRRVVSRRWRLRMKGRIVRSLHHLELKFENFLPYHLSGNSNDELSQAIRNLAYEEEIKTALVISAASGKHGIEAFLAGLLQNEKNPSIFCIGASRRRFFDARGKFQNHTSVRRYEPPLSLAEDLSEGLEMTVERIRAENHVDIFDLLLIDGYGLKQGFAADGAISKQLHGARVIILADLNGRCNYENHDTLLNDPNYFLSAHNPGLRNGYAIFKKYPTIMAVPPKGVLSRAGRIS